MEIIAILILCIGFVFSFTAGSNRTQAARKKSIPWESKAVSKGILGEEKVSQYLKKYCSKNKNAYLLNNVTLRLKDGSTTQIDHILLSTKGIFVIETKNYKGWIFADRHAKFWTKVFYKEKYKFQNPLLQNYRHVKAVQTQLGFINSKLIHNIVVFTDNAEFKTKIPEDVFLLKELIPAIGWYQSDAINVELIRYYFERLENARLKPTKETDMEHYASLCKRFS